MRSASHIAAILAASIGMAGSCISGHAAETKGDAAQKSESIQPDKPEPTRAERLDKLFARLKHQSDPAVAKRTVGRIWSLWGHSGSSTVDLLMRWAKKAMNEQDYATALDLLDQVTVLDPDYAEGWNRRATVRFMMKDYGRSMADIDKVLSIEPRHFGALSGMAGIFRILGKDELAAKALKRVLAIYPADRQAQQQLGKLADKLAGEGI